MEEGNILSLDFAKNKALTIPTSFCAEAYREALPRPMASAGWS